MSASEQAFSPLAIGPLTLRNRFIKAATNEGMAKGGIVSKGLAQFHENIAAGGSGMTTVAYCATSLDGRTFVDQAVLNTDSLADFRALTDGVHKHGAAACAQVTHAGSFTFLDKNTLKTKRPLSSSGGFNKVGVMSGRYLKKAMTEDEMEAIATEFVEASKLAREAGFDAVELHMGHGYLLSQFISPLLNKRRDAFGGSIEKRVEFPAQVLRRVLDAVGNDLAVIVKYSMTDGPKGNTIEDGVQVARRLQAEGAHMAVLSNGLNVESISALFGSSLPKTGAKPSNPIIRLGMFIQSLTEPPEVQFRENYLRELSLRVRKAVDMPLAYLGGVQSREGVEQAIGDGFDAIAMARSLVFDANFVNKLRSGATERSGCTACNQCVTMMYTPGGTSCVLTANGLEPELNTQRASA
ncbi:NADH:flavin oxidoreductase [Erythrobacter alti]|uniref:NADH:flavin oxidoreductase n=1 Tax=Erythrobacter alti TaxID=1896145 RepID=UPI0030F460CD